MTFEFYFQGQGITPDGLFFPLRTKESSNVDGLDADSLSFEMVAS